MRPRPSISKKVRFEVFKRDSFSCQYCGAKAPDVLLVLDHIKPVAKGGNSDAMNLVTSCQPCNAGKSDRQLDDHSVLSRQRQQIEELNERRAQIEMMLEWRDQLMDLEKLKADKIADIIHLKVPEYTVNEHGREDIERWVRQFDFNELLAAVDIAYSQYWQDSEKNDDARSTNWHRAFCAIGGIIRVQRAAVDRPYMRDVFYIRGILRKRFERNDDRGNLLHLLERAAEADIDLEHLKETAKRVSSWNRFKDILLDYLVEHEKAQ